MHLLTIMLPVGWFLCHVLILLIVKNKKQARPILILMGLLFLLIFAIKPYTYDLNKYSLYFNTGFIQTMNWGWHEIGEPIRLDPRDVTGEPFRDGFEIGFRSLSRLTTAILPLGQMIPRLDIDFGDFQQRTPRADAIVYLIGIIGFVLLYISARLMVFTNSVSEKKIDWSPLLTGSVVLGSVFFLVGSQNSLRQFLAISVLILGISFLSSKRFYAISIVLILLSGAFHKWVPVIGILIVVTSLIGKLDKIYMSNGNIRPFRINKSEWLSCLLGIALVLLGKAIIVYGLVHWNIPLIADLKPYVISAEQFDSSERVHALIKAIAIFVVVVCSEILLGNTSTTGYMDLRGLRRRALALSLPFVIYPEIFSRLLMIYWAIEILFLVSSLSSRDLRIRAGAALIFLSYGIAPNALNILVGSQWIHSL